MEEVLQLHLKDDGSPDTFGSASLYIRLPAPYKGYMLRFTIDGTSELCRDGLFCTNYPIDGTEFNRAKFHKLNLSVNFMGSVDLDIFISQGGAFSWHFEYTPLPSSIRVSEENSQPSRAISETNYFTVDPAFMLHGQPIPLDAISMISVVSKWMGPLKEWQQYFAYIKERGYNMVHFTPLQQRGESNSPYSIYNQLLFSQDLFDKGTSKEEQVQMISDVIKRMQDMGLLAMTDVVWNHTANNSDWLLDHPEAGYNLVNAPHLRAAFELDTALLNFGNDLKGLGLPTVLKDLEDLDKLLDGVKEYVIKPLKLWQFYVLDAEFNVQMALDLLNGNTKTLDGWSKSMSLEETASFLKLKGLRNGEVLGTRFQKTIDPNIGAAYMRCFPKEEAEEQYRRVLDEANLQFYKAYDEDVQTIMKELYDRIKYLRIDDHGPKKGEINECSPLIETYFTRLPHSERTKNHSDDSLVLANNGWVWECNPLNDFASPSHSAYLLRKVIVWGDCVKLRYGTCYDESPFLWEHMARYTRLLASIFHGFRIDNCHSTPLNVATYMLDEARKVRGDLYIAAELFTGSEHMDYEFVKRLGIGSLIREAMQAWSPGELSRLSHIYGGSSIGSFKHLDHHGVKQVRSSLIHPLFFDCSHDNEMPAQKRTPEDTLPNGALVSMTLASTGTVYGYDEVIPNHLDIVQESRLYRAEKSGIASVKALMNALHSKMGREGFTECHVHHENEYITVHRVQPQTREGYLLVAHTAFKSHSDRKELGTIELRGTRIDVLETCRLVIKGDIFTQSPVITGLPSELEQLEHPNIIIKDNATLITIPPHFAPGSIALFHTQMINYENLDAFLIADAEKAVSSLNFNDLNVLLYRSDVEEKDYTEGKSGAYLVPNYGHLVFCGLEGWMGPLREIIQKNYLGHPLCDHLREGHWALDYTIHRLEIYANEFPALQIPIQWLNERFEKIKKVVFYLTPRLFAMVIQTLYNAAVERGTSLFSPVISNGHSFAQHLALCSIQMTGIVKSTSLFPDRNVATMAAGLPHFSYDYMRCWGRDVFISLRGLLLVTGRFEEAKKHIIAFASVLKHGLIPNLLDRGIQPRYNSRDAVWFFLQSIQDYVRMAPEGEQFLGQKVKRRFLLDDSFTSIDDPRSFSYESTIAEIIHEVLQRHAKGLHFREANAGIGLDSQMSEEGFNIDIDVDWSSGLIFGGSRSNCGTWMDKMGSSVKAGNKGIPGTPRDGAAIEISGLVKSSLRWIVELQKKGLFPWKGVVTTINGIQTQVTYCEWNDKIQENFERLYYVPMNSMDDCKFAIKSDLVGRRGIYKDTFGSKVEREDYQLRPNFAIAMVVAPELFTPTHAVEAIVIADRYIRGPTGMRSLDPADPNYRPFYFNGDDSDDFQTAHGLNYHQGPEWLWCTGYFFRAALKFIGPDNGIEQTVQWLFKQMKSHRNMICNSMWRGLAELTNKDNEHCPDACPTQAWSAGTLLDLIEDIHKLGHHK